MLPFENNTDPQDRNRLKQHVIVRTSERLIVMDSAGKQIASYAIPKDVQQATLNFYEVDKEKARISERRPFPDFKYGEQLTWINMDGTILDRKDVELIGSGRHPMTQSDDWTVALVIPVPIVMGVVAVVAGPMSYIEILEQTKYADALGYSLINVWQPFVAVIILAAVLAWVCYRRQRRMDLPWTWIWVTFVVVFGVPGYLAYLFHRAGRFWKAATFAVMQCRGTGKSARLAVRNFLSLRRRGSRCLLRRDWGLGIRGTLQEKWFTNSGP